MLETTLTPVIQEIRKKHQIFVNMAHASGNEESRAAHLIAELHICLAAKIYTNCGLSGDVRLYLDKESLPKSTQQAVDYIKEQTGLNVSFPNGDQPFHILFIDVDLNSSTKTYLYHCTSKETELLDFPKLLLENKNRNRLWKEYLPEFAERMINDSRQYLETMPYRFYGITEETIILRGKSTPFSGYFQFYDNKIPYHNLSDQQISDLTTAMNAKVSHGIFAIEKDVNSHLRVHIKRAPDRVIDNPSFDFKEYCDKYDQVTDELREAFHHIRDNIRYASTTAQVRTLTIDQNLYYWFKDGNLEFNELKERFTNGPHLQHLIDELNQAWPEIKIKNATFLNSPKRCNWSSRGTEILEERIEFEYEIADKNNEALAPQREVESIIQQIINDRAKIQEVANVLADSLLNSVRESNTLKELYDTNYGPHDIDGGMLRVKISIDDTEWMLNLKEVKREAYLEQIASEIGKLTDNLLSVDLAHQKFWLNLSSSSKRRS